jgi:hypothetical protein
MTLLPARPGVLTFTSIFGMLLSKAQGDASWKQFKAGGTSHSARAATLWYLLNRCEREGVCYKLEAMPGYGYRLEPIPPLDLTEDQMVIA